MRSGRGSSVCVWLALAAIASLPRPALATFHLMEIKQVIGGVDGDTSAQAVQLKMRLAGQQFLAGQAQLVVRDATGANPVALSTFPMPNPASGACREILPATPGMAARTSPPLDAAGRDYVMNPIPASYLAAGSLTFEAIGGVVYWRTSWGGAAYTGAQNVIASPAGKRRRRQCEPGLRRSAALDGGVRAALHAPVRDAQHEQRGAVRAHGRRGDLRRQRRGSVQRHRRRTAGPGAAARSAPRADRGAGVARAARGTRGAAARARLVGYRSVRSPAARIAASRETPAASSAAGPARATPSVCTLNPE